MKLSSGCRRLALKLARHAAAVLPHAASPWAQAMHRELDYIEDDRAALRWAAGCVLASYKARLVARPGSRTRDVLRHIAASGALMLVIGLALLENAGGQTAPPPGPASDETSCDTPGRVPQREKTLPSGMLRAAPDVGHQVTASEAPCNDQDTPVRVPPEGGAP